MTTTPNHINRRSAVKLFSLGALAAATGVRLQADPKAPSAPEFRNAVIYRFQIGTNDAFAIQCGGMEVRPEQPFFAPEASPEEFAAALQASARTGTLRLPFNVLLLKWGGSYVLIDSGEPGQNGAPPPVLAHLRELGIAPEEIAHVILTHAHFDHLGGLLDDQNRPTFSRAAHYTLKAEVDFWTSPDPDVSGMRMPATDMIQMARRVFANIDFRYPKPGSGIIPGITAFHSPGHTPGHMTLRLSSGESTLYHISDLSHHARFLLENRAWSIGSDVDPALAARTRETILQTLAETRERVFGFHMPFPGLGSVARTGTGFRWVTEDWIPGRI